MIGVVTGFAIIFTVVGAGFALGRAGVFGGDGGRLVLNRVAFHAATPALLFTVVAESDQEELFSPVILVSLLAAVVTALIYAGVSAVFFRRDLATTTMGAAAASYVNSNNIGLPVGIYVLGTGAYVAPVIVLQVVLFTPLILALITAEDHRGASRARRIGHSLREALATPLVLGSIAGLVVCLAGWEIPQPVMAPLELLGGASIPLILMSFGASLTEQKMLDSPADRPAALVATAMKLVLMPAVALVLSLALGLSGTQLYAALILAALPTAQNVYNYAATYRKGEIVARDTVFLSTFLALPVMLGIAALFGG